MKTKDAVATLVMIVPLMLALAFSACDDDDPMPCIPPGSGVPTSTSAAGGGLPSTGTIVCVQNAVKDKVDESTGTKP